MEVVTLKSITFIHSFFLFDNQTIELDGVYTRRTFDKIEFLQFGVWSISYNCLHEITRY